MNWQELLSLEVEVWWSLEAQSSAMIGKTQHFSNLITESSHDATSTDLRWIDGIDGTDGIDGIVKCFHMFSLTDMTESLQIHLNPWREHKFTCCDSLVWCLLTALGSSNDKCSNGLPPCLDHQFQPWNRPPIGPWPSPSVQEPETSFAANHEHCRSRRRQGRSLTKQTHPNAPNMTPWATKSWKLL